MAFDQPCLTIDRRFSGNCTERSGIAAAEDKDSGDAAQQRIACRHESAVIILDALPNLFAVVQAQALIVIAQLAVHVDHNACKRLYPCVPDRAL